MTSRCVPATSVNRAPATRPSSITRGLPGVLAMAASLAIVGDARVHAADPAAHRPDQPLEIGGYRAPQWLAPAAGSTCVDRIFADGYQSGIPIQAHGPGTPLDYRSFGGYAIKIDRHTITITDPYGRNTVQHWGDPHENLNGKHIKDWGGAPGWSENRRSIVLGDGSKVTMTAAGPHGETLTTSIYDRDHNVQFVNASNVISHFSSDPVDTWTRDAAQFDGETALFAIDPTTMIATYDNTHNETFQANGQTTIVPILQPLGTTGGCANPNQVNDLFDDPRLGHT